MFLYKVFKNKKKRETSGFYFNSLIILSNFFNLDFRTAYAASSKIIQVARVIFQPKIINKILYIITASILYPTGGYMIFAIKYSLLISSCSFFVILFS